MCNLVTLITLVYPCLHIIFDKIIMFFSCKHFISKVLPTNSIIIIIILNKDQLYYSSGGVKHIQTHELVQKLEKVVESGGNPFPVFIYSTFDVQNHKNIHTCFI